MEKTDTVSYLFGPNLQSSGASLIAPLHRMHHSGQPPPTSRCQLRKDSQTPSRSLENIIVDGSAIVTS